VFREWQKKNQIVTIIKMNNEDQVVIINVGQQQQLTTQQPVTSANERLLLNLDDDEAVEEHGNELNQVTITTSPDFQSSCISFDDNQRLAADLTSAGPLQFDIRLGTLGKQLKRQSTLNIEVGAVSAATTTTVSQNSISTVQV
jgi:hypothetical protein